MTDIVSQDTAATLKILYAIFRKHKGKWGKGEEMFPPRKALMIYPSGTLLQMLKDFFFLFA